MYNRHLLTVTIEGNGLYFMSLLDDLEYSDDCMPMASGLQTEFGKSDTHYDQDLFLCFSLSDDLT